MIDRQLQQEIKDAISRLQNVSNDIKKDSKRALRKGGKIVLAAIQARAPIGKRKHRRYSTVKLNRRIRARKGSGNVVATYYPGNLKGAFDILNFRRSAAVFVGAKLTKGKFSGASASYSAIYGRGAYDGYYAHMIERGTRHSAARPFVSPAVQAAGPAATQTIVKTIQRKIKRNLRDYAKAKGR